MCPATRLTYRRGYCKGSRVISSTSVEQDMPTGPPIRRGRTYPQRPTWRAHRAEPASNTVGAGRGTRAPVATTAQYSRSLRAWQNLPPPDRYEVRCRGPRPTGSRPIRGYLPRFEATGATCPQHHDAPPAPICLASPGRYEVRCRGSKLPEPGLWAMAIVRLPDMVADNRTPTSPTSRDPAAGNWPRS